jgi:chemotaxis protein CheZ
MANPSDSNSTNPAIPTTCRRCSTASPASRARPAAAEPAPAHVGGRRHRRDGGDSPELEALFDSASPARWRSRPARAAAGSSRCAGPRPHAHRQRLPAHRPDDAPAARHPARARLRPRPGRGGQGHPDARQRLAYVAQMTEQAASRVLNATDIAKPIQDGCRRRRRRCPAAGTGCSAATCRSTSSSALAGDTACLLERGAGRPRPPTSS